MKNAIAFILTWLCFAFSSRDNQFKQLQTLAGGTWVMKTNKGFICEQWQRMRDKELRGKGFKIVGSDTAIEEEVQLVEKDGEVFYIPTVHGQNEGKPVQFKLTESKGKQFIFSNPEHDYPQIIGYEFVSQDSLHAWIDGNNQGKQLKIEFNYRRTK